MDVREARGQAGGFPLRPLGPLPVASCLRQTGDASQRIRRASLPLAMRRRRGGRHQIVDRRVDLAGARTGDEGLEAVGALWVQRSRAHPGPPIIFIT